MALVYTFDPQSNMWSTPNIASAGTIITRKMTLLGIIDYKGKMYLWGGDDPILYDTNYNDMFILDTINLNWGKGSLVNAPSSRFNYGAVLSPDNNIIYMGKQVIPVVNYLLFNLIYSFCFKFII